MLSFKKGDKHVHAMLHIYLLVNIVFHYSSPGNNCILSIDLPEPHGTLYVWNTSLTTLTVIETKGTKIST